MPPQFEVSRIDVSPNSLLLGNSFLRCVRPFCHCRCPPFSAGHEAFLFVCLPGDFFTFVSQVRCLHCWCPVSVVISLLSSPRFGACTAGVHPFPLAMQHFYSFVSQVISLLPQTGFCSGFSMLSKGVRLAAGQRVRLPSGLSPSVSLLVGHLCPPCLPPVSLCLRPCLPSCWSLCPPLLPSVSFCLPSCCAVPTSALQSFPFVSQLWTAVLQSCTCLACNPSSCLQVLDCSALQSFTFVSQLWACNPCNPLHLSPCVYICLPALDCRICLCLAILYLSPSSGLHVACNPLHLSPCVYICLPALDCCGRLCLAILCLPALDVASSSCRVFRF